MPLRIAIIEDEQATAKPPIFAGGSEPGISKDYSKQH